MMMKYRFKLLNIDLRKIFRKSLLICGLFFFCYGEAMEVKVESLSKKSIQDVLIVPCFQHGGGCEVACKSDEIKSYVHPVIDLGDFSAKLGETSLIYTRDLDEKRLLLLGLGEKDKLSAEAIRKAIASATKCALGKKLSTVGLCGFTHEKFEETKLCFIIAEAFHLSNYGFNRYRGKGQEEEKQLEAATIYQECSCDNDLQEAKHLVQAVNFSRDLVNGNADEITPSTLLESAKSLQKEHKNVSLSVMDRHEAIKKGLGLFAAVARASNTEPYFMVISYKGDKSSDEHSVIIGKGITYDTGGLSLKPTNGMDTMKCDMGGAAAVLGALKAIALNELKVNVTAIVAATENSIGSKAYKPGDVYTGYNGMTVEIKNTDAEGRLALADSLAYAVKDLKPTRMIDLATLTGAAEVALGNRKSALFSNDESLAKALYSAGEQTGERLWQMPLDEDYKELIKSSIADMTNCGSRAGSLIFSAMFLKEFVNDVPWAHIDIAGPAFLEKPREYHRSQATGVGVRLLYELFKNQLGKSS